MILIFRWYSAINETNSTAICGVCARGTTTLTRAGAKRETLNQSHHIAIMLYGDRFCSGTHYLCVQMKYCGARVMSAKRFALLSIYFIIRIAKTDREMLWTRAHTVRNNTSLECSPFISLTLSLSSHEMRINGDGKKGKKVENKIIRNANRRRKYKMCVMRAPFCVCSWAEHGEIASNVRVEWVNECVYVTLLPESDWWLLRIEHIFYAFLLSLKIIIAHGSTYSQSQPPHVHTHTQQLRTMLYWNRMMRARSLGTGTRARQRGRKPAQTHRVSSVSSESKHIRIYIALCRFKGLEVAPKRTVSFSPTANTIIRRPYTDFIRAHQCHSLQRECDERVLLLLLFSRLTRAEWQQPMLHIL